MKLRDYQQNITGELIMTDSPKRKLAKSLAAEIDELITSGASPQKINSLVERFDEVNADLEDEDEGLIKLSRKFYDYFFDSRT